MSAEKPADKERVRGRPFKKGQSGNPAGKPRGTSLASKIRKAFEDEVQRSTDHGSFEEWLATQAIVNDSLPHLQLAMQKGWPTPSEVTLRQPDAIAVHMIDLIRQQREALAREQRAAELINATPWPARLVAKNGGNGNGARN